MAEPGPTRALSTEIGTGYKTKTEPKNVNIKIGNKYELTDGYGTKQVTIVSIRKIDDEIIIYYKYKKENTGNSIWASDTYIQQSVNLQTFKAQLLEYGQVDSIDLLYPQRKDGTDYYPNN